MLKFNRREFTRVLAGTGGVGLFSFATEVEPRKVNESKPGPGSITDVQAGARHQDGRGFAGLTETLKRRLAHPSAHASLKLSDEILHSTALAVVATNVYFNKL